MKKTLIQRAKDWIPQPDDEQGEHKKAFLGYLIAHCNGRNHAQTIRKIMRATSLDDDYKREEFQRKIMVPLREDDNVFIGTSIDGIYLVTDAEAAYSTINFYTNRIRSERKHLRNLTRLAEKTNIFKDHDFVKPPEKRRNIYFDESGTPSMNYVEKDPFFIVTAVILPDRKSELLLDRKFALIKKTYGKSEGFEMKSSAFNKKEYTFILQELSTLDYEFAVVCFLKRRLSGKGFEYPKSFYKFAYGFMVDKVLDSAIGSGLYFDEYSSQQSSFNNEFIEYILKNNSFFKSQHIKISDSRKYAGIQLADLICGVFRNKLENSFDLVSLIQDKVNSTAIFPIN